jgi:hypothetical protein
MMIEQRTGDPSTAGCVVKDFRDLQVWQRAHQLTLAVYRITASFPVTRQYGMTGSLS